MSQSYPCRVRQPFFSPGTFILLAVAVVGFSFGFARFVTGLASVTNLNTQFPWGIWVAIDVACGVALAAGGFTAAALIEIFGRKRFLPLLRPAILTAWLGYAMVGFALLFDLGRYWNAWRPVFNWQGNSVLFEVGMCVMAYLSVLTIEMAPALLEEFRGRVERREWASSLALRLLGPARALQSVVRVVLPLCIIAGVVLSSMHQSSLGTLMVIAPTKLSPFWYTPWLPVLFLLSAVMVGFPMVIVESILAARAFGREPEMEVLEPLARLIPWFIGIYGAAKIWTLVARAETLDIGHHPGCTVALSVELLLGLAVPFLMLLFGAIRRSPGWLLFAALLVVFGVVLNRLNVFLVGYHPPFVEKTYFPSVGEIGVTAAIVASLILLYRFFVINFPIITGPECIHQAPVAPVADPVAPRQAWAVRSATATCLVGFVGLYAVVHRESIDRSLDARHRLYRLPPTHNQAPEKTLVKHTSRPQAYSTLFMIHDAAANEPVDDYAAVRFSHRSHDAYTKGNCAVCHHRVAFGDDDREGVDLGELHAMMEIRLGPACSSCHGDMEDNSPQGCRHCHNLAAEADFPARPGLHGAHHRQCIGCHERAEGDAPTDCDSCHHPNVPDHKDLVGRLPADATKEDVTSICLGCHLSSGLDVLDSVHWNWGGHSPNVLGYEHHVDLGLETVLNNYLICAGSDASYCSTCHIGFGRNGDAFDATDPEGIDCLICHDTTSKYNKGYVGDKSYASESDLESIVHHVGRPSRASCGHCHFYSDGGPNVKHGDLEPILADPPADFDVHMGRYEMICQDCHKTENHRIAGRSHSAPATEGPVECADCHGAEPHSIAGILGPHLDDHLASVACETCHIPHIAKDAPTRRSVDFSQAGEDRVPATDEYGMPTYDKRLGEQRWALRLRPDFAWHDGTRDAYVLGEEIDPDGVTVLNAPLGQRDDPRARIFPFKLHRAVQPYDSENLVLATPRLSGGYWEDFDWLSALATGMEAVGLEFSGNFGFTETVMYTSIHHEVVPKADSLGCADCHATESVTCSRCHSSAAGLELSVLADRRYPDEDPWLDFAELGYDGDPAEVGGRFAADIGRGLPTR